LTKYRGCTCVEWEVYNNDEVGNTVHFMTENIDEGPIVRIQKVNISKKESYHDLRFKIFYSGIELLIDVIKDFCHQNINANDFSAQENGEYFSVIPKGKLGKVIQKLESGIYKYQL
jgi:methionyl-tRNA formyltransferase